MSQEEDMGAKNPETEQADDVATLYSWANLHGAKYRDFSGARQEMRAQMRQRTLAEQARAVREEVQKQIARVEVEEEGDWEEVFAQSAARPSSANAHGESEALRQEFASEAHGEAHHEPSALRNSSEIRVAPSGSSAPVAAPRYEQPSMRSAADSRVQPPGSGSHVSSARYALPVREQEFAPGQRPSGARLPEAPAAAVGPAWLAERKPSGSQVQPAESLQQSRERVASRWFALQGIFGRGREEAITGGGGDSRTPVLTVFSLAGGVGKSTLVASLGRALAARGEKVLLADTCTFGLLPFYFGAREVKPGVVRTFSGAPSDPPIRVLTVDAERETADGELLRRELARSVADVGRVVIDVATASLSMMRQAVRMSSVVLVPIVPDVASMVTLQSLESFFRNQEGMGGRPPQVCYLLNKFDPSFPLHLDLREVLRQQLGERLLPFAVHRSMAFSEALAEGMTVVDYAPNSPAVEELMNLVTWVRSASVAGAAGSRGSRWSER
jgi:cellulose biosynthesis protein BcsQ